MLLSSVAEAMFWTGRYVERAQDTARVVLSYERLSMDLPASRRLELGPLFKLSDLRMASGERAAALGQLTFDADNPSSVLGALSAARENLRQARVVAPVELWTTVSALVQAVKAHERGDESAVLEALELTLSLGSRFEGERQAGMTHDSAHAFLELGTNLERADMQVRALDALLPALLREGWERAFDDVRWSGLLQALGLQSAYRRLHHHQSEVPRLLGLALADANCPRSVLYCLSAVERSLSRLPHAGRVRLELGSAIERARAAAKPTGSATGSELASLASALAAIAESLEATYFPRTELPLTAPEPEKTVVPEAGPFQQLCREHAEVDAVLGVLEALALDAQGGKAVDRGELRVVVDFLTDCGELGHHEKEESILTPVLVGHGFDWYDGPLSRMRREHRQEHYFIRVLSQLITQSSDWSREDARSFHSVATELCHFLHSHMDHEQHELFGQADRILPQRVKDDLQRAFHELDARQSRQAAAARAAASALVRKYERRVPGRGVSQAS
jgi:uncharacterized alpha-E superfamily protein/hemerythrin-like domain-containing protein